MAAPSGRGSNARIDAASGRARQPSRRRRACALAGTLVTTALVLLAPQLAAAESLSEAMRAAYQNNPQLDAERSRLRATDEEVPRALSGYRPTVRGSLEAGVNSTGLKPRSSTAGETMPWGYEVTLSQPIFSGFRTRSAVDEAEATVRAGRENLRLVESRTLLDTVVAYADVVRTSEVLRLREHNVAVLSRELEAAQARRAAREVTLTDVAQARARRARAVSAADLAKAELKIARANYLRIVGHAPSGLRQPGVPRGLLPAGLDQALAIAEQESPNVVSALYREQEARFAVDKVRGELLPQVSVEASFAERNDISSLIDRERDASITGRISVPLYQGGEVHARVRQAKHRHVSRMQEIEQARGETQANVTSAWSRLKAAEAQLRSDQVQVDAARTALDGVRQEERVGQRTLLDVLNAEQEYLDAQVDMVGTRRDLVVAAYALIGAMGRLEAGRVVPVADVYDPEAHYVEVRNDWFGTTIAEEERRPLERQRRPTPAARYDDETAAGAERRRPDEVADEVAEEVPAEPPSERYQEPARQNRPGLRGRLLDW